MEDLNENCGVNKFVLMIKGVGIAMVMTGTRHFKH